MKFSRWLMKNSNGTYWLTAQKYCEPRENLPYVPRYAVNSFQNCVAVCRWPTIKGIWLYVRHIIFGKY